MVLICSTSHLSFTKTIRSFSSTVDDLILSTSTTGGRISETRNEETRRMPPHWSSRERRKSRSRERWQRSSSRSRKERSKSAQRKSRSRGKSISRIPNVSDEERRKSRGEVRNKTPTPTPSASSSRKDAHESLRRHSPSPRTNGDEQYLNMHSRERGRSLSRRGRSIERWGRNPSQNRSGSHNQTKVALLLPDEQILEQNGNDTKSSSLKAAEELTKRPKKGEIYKEVVANVKSIEKRLKYLSENLQLFSIDEAIEIADAAYLLRLLKKPNHEIEMAGQMAHRGALLMLQADILSKKGKELLEQSKNKLKLTIL